MSGHVLACAVLSLLRISNPILVEGEPVLHIVIQDEKLIACPIETVRAQFADMAHHQATQVHTDLKVSNVRAQNGKTLFTGRRRVFGMPQQDEIEVTQYPDGRSTLRSLTGSNQGLLITQQFESLGHAQTRVRTIV